MININGKTFKSVRAACLYYSVDSSNLSKEAKVRGRSRQELLQEKLQNGIRKHSFIYDGERYANLTEVCQYYHLDHIKVRSLIDNRGISRVEALDLSIMHLGNVPTNRKGNSMPITINGIQFASKLAAIRHFDIPSSKFYRLQRKGYTPQQIVNYLIEL